MPNIPTIRHRSTACVERTRTPVQKSKDQQHHWIFPQIASLKPPDTWVAAVLFCVLPRKMQQRSLIICTRSTLLEAMATSCSGPSSLQPLYYDGFCSAAVTETCAARTGSAELTDGEPGACNCIASGNASSGGKHFDGVTVGCICGSKHLGGVIGGDNGGGNGGGNGDSAGGNGDLMLWPFLAATGCASATSFLNRPMLLFQCFLACSNSRACASKSSWYFSNCIHRKLN